MDTFLTEKPTASAFREKDRIPLHVFIAYEDQAAYRRALRVLVNVAQQLDDDSLEIRPMPWSFDDLANPILRRNAGDDVTRAPILILTKSADGPLPDAITEWLPECMEQKRGSGAAIVSLTGVATNAEPSNCNENRFVRKTAEMTGWDFIGPSEACST
jgi:hypothetical protein